MVSICVGCNTHVMHQNRPSSGILITKSINIIHRNCNRHMYVIGNECFVSCSDFIYAKVNKPNAADENTLWTKMLKSA
jgi:hypothetical protein